MQRILDWCHISRRFEHVLQRLRGLRKTDLRLAGTLLKRVESAKWRLWHGRAAGCLERLKAVQFRLVHYAERYCQGLPISTSAAESSVEWVIGDRFRKNRKMRWTNEGANSLLHIGVSDLNGELASVLRRRHWRRPKQSDDNNPWRYWWMSWPAWVASRSWTT